MAVHLGGYPRRLPFVETVGGARVLRVAGGHVEPYERRELLAAAVYHVLEEHHAALAQRLPVLRCQRGLAYLVGDVNFARFGIAAGVLRSACNLVYCDEG